MANDTPLTVVGNLTADPELRFTPAGVAMARFTVAATPRAFDKTRNTWIDGEAMFLGCTAWRTLAEHTAESLTKGTRVVVTGRLRQHHWTTDTGEKRSAFGLDVDEIGPSLRFATAKVTKATRGSADYPPTGPATSDDPWSTPTPVPVGAGEATPPF
ncbi:single-strand binding protein [Candidatus Protofrankia datiscae]|uniref:Single-stranded DNA-binding protein n=1 Tax=Candidatus Protofrankia datiscae TaxID=2716812 RepID=F8AYN8_9ACTN|nr:single-stranded DNA-binding protein [Candidatus Protofrankia datiscae]AEH07703.1 single-strand binding protein [Candidatus Protofrankia datiscae]AEH11613.1 single-strand binding protein [Candidatus Protofrankia datiscae]